MDPLPERKKFCSVARDRSRSFEITVPYVVPLTTYTLHGVEYLRELEMWVLNKRQVTGQSDAGWMQFVFKPMYLPLCVICSWTVQGH